MTGECGRIVRGHPGYAGYVPSSALLPPPTKTSVNTHMALQDRTAPSQLASTMPERGSKRVEISASGAMPPGQSYFLPRRQIVETTTSSMGASHVRSAKDIPPRPKPTTTDAVKAPPFDAVTDRQASEAKLTTGVDHKFFSRIRMQEQAITESRESEHVKATRSSGRHGFPSVLRSKVREGQDDFKPPAVEHHQPPRRPPNVARANESDAVKFHYAPAMTSYQREMGNFGENPRMRSPAEGQNTLNTTATSRDLFDGTVKTVDHIIPGFTGHIPASTTAVLKKPENDTLKSYSKEFIRQSAPISSIPGYSGFSPKSSHNDRGAALPIATSEFGKTTTGRAQFAVALDKDEKAMNKKEGGKTCAVRHFFTAGHGQADNTIADQFCVRYRPMEGFMKMGPSSSRGWIAESDLRKKTRL